MDCAGASGAAGSDPQKVRIAARLRRETTMTLEWIAKRLFMGSPTQEAPASSNPKSESSAETLF